MRKKKKKHLAAGGLDIQWKDVDINKTENGKDRVGRKDVEKRQSAD